ncbi:MAG: hypothetical protein ABIS18_09350 [Actinomycetota bacterium]
MRTACASGLSASHGFKPVAHVTGAVLQVMGLLFLVSMLNKKASEENHQATKVVFVEIPDLLDQSPIDRHIDILPAGYLR